LVAKLGDPATGAIAAGWVRQARATAQAAGRALTVDDLVAEVAPAERRNPDDVWRRPQERKETWLRLRH